MTQAPVHARAPLASAAREMMEALNVEAAPLNIWLRTQANAPAQRPWFTETELSATGSMSAGRVATVDASQIESSVLTELSRDHRREETQ